jgi:hypothetical protein
MKQASMLVTYSPYLFLQDLGTQLAWILWKGMPSSQKQNVILVLVGRFTKYVLFIPLAHPYITSRVASLFLQHSFKLHDFDKPSLWVEWLSLVQFWFNTNYQTSIKMTSFEALYGYLSPKLLKFTPGTTRVVAIEELFHHRQQILNLLEDNVMKILHGSLSTSCNKTTHTLWARCFEGRWAMFRPQPYIPKPRMAMLKYRRLSFNLCLVISF